MEAIEYSLLIHTDSYTGNTDNRLLAVLFNIDDERSGGEENVNLHKEIFTEEETCFLESIPVMRPDYGEEYQGVYTIDEDDHERDYWHLEIFAGGGKNTKANLLKAISIFKEKIGDTVTLKDYNYSAKPGEPTWTDEKVTILGYSIKKTVSVTTVERIP